MNRALLFAASLLLPSALAASLSAAPVVENEAVLQAVNNSIATAQAIPASAFTTPVPGTVFNPPGFATATVNGSGGGPDVDFFSFFALGGQAYFDIDNPGFTFDTILSLFDSSGNLIAYSDDSSPPDAGSASNLDAFLGVVDLPGAGTYYLAVSQWSNFPQNIDHTGSQDLFRPDGEFGGVTTAGGDPTFGSNGADDGLGYVLHISLQYPTPEPASIAAWSLVGLIGGAFALRRLRRRGGK